MYKKILLVSLTALSAVTLASCGDSTKDTKTHVNSNDVLANSTLSGAKFFSTNSVKGYSNSFSLFGESQKFTKDERTQAETNFTYVSTLVSKQDQKTDVNLDDYSSKALSDLTALKALFKDETLTLEILKTNYIAFQVSVSDISGASQKFLYLYKDKTTEEPVTTETSTSKDSATSTEESTSSKESQTTEEASSTVEKESKVEEEKETKSTEEVKKVNTVLDEQSKKTEKETSRPADKQTTENKQNKKGEHKVVKKDYTDNEVYHLEGAALLLASDDSLSKLFHFDLKNEQKTEKNETEKETKITLTRHDESTGAATTDLLVIKNEEDTEATEHEISYKYTYSEGGVEKKSIKVNFEEENGVKEWSVKQTSGSDTSKYSFEEVKKDTVTWIKAKIKASTKKEDMFKYDTKASKYVWEDEATDKVTTPAEEPATKEEE